MAMVLGIAGGTGAGKTTIARAVIDTAGGATLLDLDSYYRDRRDMPAAARHRLNFDQPDAIDSELLVEHLDRLIRGEPVRKPVYSFATHCRVDTVTVAPQPLIVVEGLFAFWWREVRSRLDLKVFVDAPADLRLARRIRRDVAERGRSVEEVLEQYLSTVRHMHERYVEPLRSHADIVVVNEGSIPEAVDRIVSTLGSVIRGGGGRRHSAAMEQRYGSPTAPAGEWP